MKELNKYWIYLIVIGVFTLIATFGWELWQISSENRSEFTYEPLPLEQDYLVLEDLKTHLYADPDFTPATNGVVDFPSDDVPYSPGMESDAMVELPSEVVSYPE